MMNALKSLVQWKGSIPQGGLLDFVLKVILALIVYFIGTKLIGWFCKKLRKQLMKFGSDEATKSFLLSGIKIGMHLILILTIAGNLGVDKTSVAALVGSAGVAISLALQGGLSNFAGGLIIMFLRPFSVGDYIIENGEKTEGTVLHDADDHRQPPDRDSELRADERQYHECNRDGKKKAGDQGRNFL